MKTRNLNIEQALAEIIEYGGIRQEAQLGWPPARVDGRKIEWDQEERAREACARAYRHGRDWNWRAAELALDAAYAALGAANPGSGYAWHTGAHPLCTAIAEERERETRRQERL